MDYPWQHLCVCTLLQLHQAWKIYKKFPGLLPWRNTEHFANYFHKASSNTANVLWMCLWSKKPILPSLYTSCSVRHVCLDILSMLQRTLNRHTNWHTIPVWQYLFRGTTIWAHLLFILKTLASWDIHWHLSVKVLQAYCTCCNESPWIFVDIPLNMRATMWIITVEIQ